MKKYILRIILMFLCLSSVFAEEYEEDSYPILENGEIVRVSPKGTVFRIHTSLPTTDQATLYSRIKTEDRIAYWRVVPFQEFPGTTKEVFVGPEIQPQSVVLRQDPRLWQGVYGSKSDFMYTEIKFSVPEELIKKRIVIEVFFSHVTEGTFHLAKSSVPIQTVVENMNIKSKLFIPALFNLSFMNGIVFDAEKAEKQFAPLVTVFESLEFIVEPSTRIITQTVASGERVRFDGQEKIVNYTGLAILVLVVFLAGFGLGVYFKKNYGHIETISGVRVNFDDIPRISKSLGYTYPVSAGSIPKVPKREDMSRLRRPGPSTEVSSASKEQSVVMTQETFMTLIEKFGGKKEE